MSTLRCLTAIALAAAAAASAAPLGAALEDPHPTHQCRDSAARRAIRARARARALAEHKAATTPDTGDAARGFGAQADTTARPLRIRFAFDDLHVDGHYCDGGRHATVPDFEGGRASCGPAAHDLTAEKRDFLMKKLLPAAASRMTRLFSVVPLADQIKVGDCGQLTVNGELRAGAGEADIVLLVSAVPGGAGRASADMCQTKYHGGAFRPTAGYVNFHPHYISVRPDDFAYQLQVATHELFHTLGFHRDNFGKFSPFKVPTAEVERRGSKVTVLQGPAILREGKAHFGCEDFDGIELEGEGGWGTVGGHWERRMMKDDVMCGLSGPNVSRMLLALFEDLRYYTPNYSAADEVAFGKGAGCGFFRERCNTPAGGRDEFFCFDKNQRHCSADRTAVESCKITDFGVPLPQEFQYFPGQPTIGGGQQLLDYCPVMAADSNRRCTTTARDAADGDGGAGHYFGADSRCVDRGGSAGEANLCLQTRCRGAVLDIRLPVTGAPWVECATGRNVIHPGMSGYLVCPAPADICSGPSAPAASPAPGVSPAPAPALEEKMSVRILKVHGGTLTLRVELRDADADATMTSPKRFGYLKALTKQMRTRYAVRWPKYKAKRVFWQNKATGFWVVKLTFTGPPLPTGLQHMLDE